MEEKPIYSAPQEHYTEPVQQNLPNSTPVLIMGILSIVLSLSYFLIFGVIFGIVLGIIAIVMATKEMSLYQQTPGKFTLSSYNNVKVGRTCAIIGLIVAAIFLFVIILVIFGLFATMPFWGMIE